MKRIITAIVALAMILSVLYLTACAEKQDTQKRSEENESRTADHGDRKESAKDLGIEGFAGRLVGGFRHRRELPRLHEDRRDEIDDGWNLICRRIDAVCSFSAKIGHHVTVGKVGDQPTNGRWNERQAKE